MSYAFDPELAPLAAALTPPIGLEDPERARAALREEAAAAPAPDTSALTIDDREVPARDGGLAVPIRVYRPRSDQSGAALLFLHAGGFVIGSIDTEHALCVKLATALQAVVVSVGYRLAPEHPFPAALEDSYAAWEWLAANTAELAVDPQRLGLYGRSAGGGLAAAVALLARDRGGPRACFQFLSMPVLDDRMATASARRFTDTPVWDRPNAELSWRHYLGDLAGTDEVSPYAAPARATDLSDLPPAYIMAVQFDPVRDEDVMYAQRLLTAGVTTELHVTPGTFHGSASVESAAISKRIEAEQFAVLKRALG